MWDDSRNRDREMSIATEPRPAQSLALTIGAKTRKALNQFANCDTSFDSGKRISETNMPAGRKGKMRVLLTANINTFRVIKNVRVAICAA